MKYSGFTYKYMGLKPLKEMITDITTYGILNGKCAWCGKNAEKLKMKHFQKHEEIDKTKKIE